MAAASQRFQDARKSASLRRPSPYQRLGLRLRAAAATSARRTPRPASTRGTGKTRSSSIRIVTEACRPAPRSTRTNAGRSALPAVRSTSRRWPVSDGRKAGLTNSGFGTVFGVADGKPLPVCDYAGFAPFGFGYRRCPGEQLTIEVFADFLRKVWRDKIAFRQAQPAQSGKGPDRAERGDRRRYRLHQAGLRVGPRPMPSASRLFPNSRCSTTRSVGAKRGWALYLTSIGVQLWECGI